MQTNLACTSNQWESYVHCLHFCNPWSWCDCCYWWENPASYKSASFKRGTEREHTDPMHDTFVSWHTFYRAIINLPRKSLKMEHFIIWKENAAGNVINWQFFKLLMDKIQYTQQLPLVGKDLSQSCNETSQSHDGVAFNFWCSRGYYVIQFDVYARINVFASCILVIL